MYAMVWELQDWTSPPFCCFLQQGLQCPGWGQSCALAACEEPVRSYSLFPAWSQALEWTNPNIHFCGREFAFVFSAGGSNICLWLEESELENLLLLPYGREVFWAGWWELHRPSPTCAGMGCLLLTTKREPHTVFCSFLSSEVSHFNHCAPSSSWAHPTFGRVKINVSHQSCMKTAMIVATELCSVWGRSWGCSFQHLWVVSACGAHL